MEFKEYFLCDAYVPHNGAILFFCPLCGNNCEVSSTTGVSAHVTLRVLRHLAMDAMDNSLERLSMLTTESARAAFLAFAPQLGGSDPQEVKDMLTKGLSCPH